MKTPTIRARTDSRFATGLNEEGPGSRLREFWQRYQSISVSARLAIILIVGYVVLLIVNAAPIGNLHTGDTDLLVQGARQTIRCLGRGTLIGCGHTKGALTGKVGPYALLQYLPTMALLKLGLTNNQVVRALGSVNLVAFVASLVVVALVAKRLRPGVWGPVLVLALVGSSLTYQSTSGFGEMLAAFFTLLAVSAVLWRRAFLIVGAMALATIGKETPFPFLLILGLLAGRGEEDGYLPPWRVWVPLLTGIAVGEFLNVGFDEFRFAADKNVFYLQPIFRTPGLERKANYLAAVWVAPSNGALWYWALATLVVAAVGIVALLQLKRRPKNVFVWLPPLLAVGVLLGFAVALTDWYTPFGWIAYGPRLLVPFFPAALVVTLYTGGPLLATPLRRLLSNRLGVGITVLVVIAGGWAQFGAPWSYAAAILRLNMGTNGCPMLTKLILQDGQSFYYHCAQQVMWRLHPIVLKSAATSGGGVAWAGRVMLSIASMLLVADLVGRVRARRANASLLSADVSIRG